jgi:hypothetical protein
MVRSLTLAFALVSVLGTHSLAADGAARVLVITSNDSPQCAAEMARLAQPGGTFETMRARGWKIGSGPDNHLQVVDQSQADDVVRQIDSREFPIVVYVEGPEIVRAFRAGCTTPLDIWTFAWLAKGIDERPPGEVPEKARVETTGNYPLRGNHWTIDGDASPSLETLIHHLRGPVHGPQIKPTQLIETWSYEELRSLHDNLHEIEMGGVQFTSRPRPNPSSAPRTASSKALGW